MKNIEPNETPSCLVLCLLIVFTRQLEILVTTLLSFQGPSRAPVRPLRTSKVFFVSRDRYSAKGVLLCLPHKF